MGGRGARFYKSSRIKKRIRLRDISKGRKKTNVNRKSDSNRVSKYSEKLKVGLTPEQRKSVIEAEKLLRDDDTAESVYIINVFGKVVYYNTGDRNHVDIDVNSFHHGSDYAIVHNHSSGGTFSVNDLQANKSVLATRLSIVTPTSTYILRHTGVHIGVDATGLADAYKRASKSNSLKIAKMFLSKKHYSKIRMNYLHQWLMNHSKEFGFEYFKEDIKND